MGKTRMLIGLAAALCAFAVTAGPAFGHAFVGSKTGLLTGKGYEEIEKTEFAAQRPYEPEHMQEWHLGFFHVLCYTEHSEGALPEVTANSITLTVKFSSCGYYPNVTKNIHFAAVFPKEGIKVKFSANGWIETLENGEEVEFKGEIEPGAGWIKIEKACKIQLLKQTIPVKAVKNPEEEFSTVLYSNITQLLSKPSKEFPTGEQAMVLFTNAWKTLKYKYGEGEEYQCTNPEFWEKQAEEGAIGGSYRGQFYVKLKGGNLSYE